MRFDTHIPVRLKDAFAARHEPEAHAILARVYWTVCISFGFICVLGSVAYGAWEFSQNKIQDGTLIDVHPQIQVSKAQLQGVLKKFEERRARFEERLQAPVSIKDPAK